MTTSSPPQQLAQLAPTAPATRTRGLPIVDRFLLKLVVGSTLGALGWFLGILLIAVVITGLQKLVTNALSGGEMVVFVALQLPRMIVFALPMAVLFGCVQAFAALSRQGEAVALGAAGVSLIRMMRAPMIWALLLTALLFWLSDSLVPPLERNKDAILVSHLQAHIGKGGFRFQDPADDEDSPLKTLVQAQGFDIKTATLREPRVQIFDDQQRVARQIVAQSGRWTGTQWMLYNATLTKFQTAEAGATSPNNTSPRDTSPRDTSPRDTSPRDTSPRDTSPNNTSPRDTSPRDTSPRDTSPRDTSVRDTSVPVVSRFAELAVQLPPPEFLGRSSNSLQKRLELGDFLMISLSQVVEYRQTLIEQLPRARTPAQRARTLKLIKSATFGLHDKIAGPLICLAFALVGLPLGLHSPRSGGGALGLSFVVLVVYYVIWTWCSTLGRPGAVNPVAMAYAPLLLVTIIGALLVWRRNR